MTKRHLLDIIQNNFTSEKEFITDGYYRVRSINQETVELAFLVGGPCGETIVHPQITIHIENDRLIGEKLIDLYTTPTTILYREENGPEIDKALQQLLLKFLSSKQLDEK